MVTDLPETPVELLQFLVRPVTTDDLNEYYHLLSNRRRRLVIARVFVRDPGGSIEVKPLARQIAGVEAMEDPGTVPSSKYDAVYNGLIQSHLSALDNAGIIIYASDRKRVRRGPAINAAVVMLAATIVILRLLGLRTRGESSR